MKTAYSIVEILNELYNDNLSILMNQNHELLEKKPEFNSLFKSFTFSNERLKNIINTIKIIES